MHNSCLPILILAMVSGALPLAAQQPCPSMFVVANSPEDQLVMAVNGAENPQDQIAALDKYAQGYGDSKFMPCVNEYYTATFIKLNNFDKAIEYGEKDLAANYGDVNLSLSLAKAYVGAGRATDAAFSLIMKAPEQIKAESNPARPPGVSDADWQKNQQTLAEAGQNVRAYMEYGFFQLLGRVSDPKQRLQYLDAFSQAYAGTPNAGQVSFQYFVAYKMLNDTAKADEYGEKVIAADPNNVAALNTVADDYATGRVNLDKAAGYAKKVIDLAPTLKKPDGVSDADFHLQQNAQLGAAHLTLGYIDFQRGSPTHRVAPAIQELKTASDLLSGNPQGQARALYYLGYAYEVQTPPNHRAAADALDRAAKLQTPWQSEARALRAKIPR
jgi:tetratricopeptide (TPR) repeat protein